MFLFLGGKYMILHDGSLHIYRADPSDGYRSYNCKTNHTLTGEVRKSSSGRVIITGKSYSECFKQE